MPSLMTPFSTMEAVSNFSSVVTASSFAKDLVAFESTKIPRKSKQVEPQLKPQAESTVLHTEPTDTALIATVQGMMANHGAGNIPHGHMHHHHLDAVPTRLAPMHPSAHQAAVGMALPPGVSIPPSMDASILLTSERALSLLRQLTPPQVQAALFEFVDAMQANGDRVRNVQAYLVGVIKKYIQALEKDPNRGITVQDHHDSLGPNIAAGDEMAPLVKTSLNKLIDSGFCSPGEISDKVMTKLNMLGEKNALLAINEISGCQRDKIRNFSSYFLGILNRYLKGEELPRQHRISRSANRHDRSRDRRSSVSLLICGAIVGYLLNPIANYIKSPSCGKPYQSHNLFHLSHLPIFPLCNL